MLDISYELLSIIVEILSEIGVWGRLQCTHVCALHEIAVRDEIGGGATVIRLVGLVSEVDAVLFLPRVVNVLLWPHDLLASLVLSIEIEPRLDMKSDLSSKFLSAALLNIHGPLPGMIEVIVLDYDALGRDLRWSESRETKAKVRLVFDNLMLIANGVDSLVLPWLGHLAFEVRLS